jgi:anti-anti-sigma factor
MEERQLELHGRAVADVLYEDAHLRVVRTGSRAVALYGEIDFSNSRAVADALDRVRAETGDVIVADVGGLAFVDVSGMRVLALPHLQVRARWLWLCNIPRHLSRLLALLGWDPAAAMR